MVLICFIAKLAIYHTFAIIGVATVDFAKAPAESELTKFIMGRYEWPVRPVKNYTDRLLVLLGFQLTRIVGLDLKNQVLTLNIKLEQEWTDYKLTWDPDQFGGVRQIILPSDHLWKPDITLYNTLGPFEPFSKLAVVQWNGVVKWNPTVLMKSYCPIKVQHYPFDIQTCTLTFGSWTYDSNKTYFTFKGLPEKDRLNEKIRLPVGMDLKDFWPSTEWDLISIPANFIVKYYPPYKEAYVRILFKLTVRRHFNFYLINLVLPLVGLSYLSLVVFYLPADSGEKITLCVSLLTSQIMFLVLMIDNIPVTSLAVPLLGKIIIFNMTLLFCSILGTTLVLNVHFRTPTKHDMPNWVKNMRQNKLVARILCMDKWPPRNESHLNSSSKWAKASGGKDISKLCSQSVHELCNTDLARNGMCHQQVQKAFQNIFFIREYIERQEKTDEECENWKYLAALMDRFFLICFNAVFFIVMLLFLTDAPALFDQRVAVDQKLSRVRGSTRFN